MVYAMKCTNTFVGDIKLQNMSPECNDSIYVGLCFSVTYIYFIIRNISLVLRKPVFGVSDLAQHKPGCTTTQDG